MFYLGLLVYFCINHSQAVLKSLTGLKIQRCLAANLRKTTKIKTLETTKIKTEKTTKIKTLETTPPTNSPPNQ